MEYEWWRLTPAEIEALQALADTGSTHQSARVLRKGHETVRTQVASARRKLDAKTATHAVALAFRQDLIG